MSRLDDAGVNRADRDFVNFVPGHLEEIRDTCRYGNFRRAVPGVVPCAVGMMEPNRFQPRMAFRMNAPLLGDFAFEPMRLRTGRRQRGITVGHGGRGQRQLPICVVGQHGKQTHAVSAGRLPEQRRDARAVFTSLQKLFAEIGVVEIGNFRERHGVAVTNKIGGAGFH